MAKRRPASTRNIISRTALVAAFVLAFAAVIFNTNLVANLGSAFRFTAQAAQERSAPIVAYNIDSLILIGAIVALLLLSLIGRARKPLPPRHNKNPG
jgi:hypothetical protein